MPSSWCRVPSLLLILLANVAMGQAQQPGVLRLPWEQWQMHLGDDPRCAAIHDSGCVWRPFHGGSFTFYASGPEWQRIETTLPLSLRESGQLAILVQGEQPVYEVFVNGQSIGGSGNFKSHWGPQDSRTILKLSTTLPADGRIVITIRALSVGTSAVMAGFVPTIAPIGKLKGVSDQDTLDYLRASWQHYVFFGAMGCIGFLFFLLFAVNTNLREYFWTGALLSLLSLFRLGEIASVLDLGMYSSVGFILFNVLNSIQPLILIEFVFSFVGKSVPKLFRIVQLVGTANAANLILLLPLPMPVFIPFASFLAGPPLRITGGCIVVAVLTQFLAVAACLRSELLETRWIGGAILFLTAVELYMQLIFSGLLDLPQTIQWGSLEFDLRPVAWLLFAIAMLITMTFRLRRIQGRNREVEQEMAAARSVQQVLIPDQLPTIPGLRIESAYFPAKDVGGDFFQILQIPRRGGSDSASAFIVLGDVSGKGLKAAMTVSLIVGSLRTSATYCTSPAQLLTEINRTLLGRSDGFATCIVLMFLPSDRLTMANAGHTNPYLDGVEIQTEANLPLGLDADVRYSEITIQIAPGSLCTLVTDGVIEATSPSGELYGFERTEAISNRPAKAIAEAARQFGQEDDITVLSLTNESVGAFSVPSFQCRQTPV